MASRKLKVESVELVNESKDGVAGQTVLIVRFSRKLTQLEVSGVKAVLDGEIK